MKVSELGAPEKIDRCPACEVDGLQSTSRTDGKGGGDCSRGHAWWIKVDQLFVMGVDQETFARIHQHYAAEGA